MDVNSARNGSNLTEDSTLDTFAQLRSIRPSAITAFQTMDSIPITAFSSKGPQGEVERQYSTLGSSPLTFIRWNFSTPRRVIGRSWSTRITPGSDTSSRRPHTLLQQSPAPSPRYPAQTSTLQNSYRLTGASTQLKLSLGWSLK